MSKAGNSGVESLVVVVDVYVASTTAAVVGYLIIWMKAFFSVQLSTHLLNQRLPKTNSGVYKPV